jgi:hypothetical protein
LRDYDYLADRAWVFPVLLKPRTRREEVHIKEQVRYREIAIGGWELTRNWDLDYQKPDFDKYKLYFGNDYAF